jgi:hypothetical protein
MPRYKILGFTDNTVPRYDVGPGKTLGPDGTALQSSGVIISDTDVMTASGFSLGDNEKLLLGTGGDASLMYNGTDTILNPREVGTGGLQILGDLKIDGEGDDVQLFISENRRRRG